MSRSQDALDPCGNAKWKARTSAKETTQLLGGGCGVPERKQPPNRVHHLGRLRARLGGRKGTRRAFAAKVRMGVAGRRPGHWLASYLVLRCFFPLLEGCPEVLLASWGKGRESVLWGLGVC